MRITKATFAGSSQKLDQRPKLRAPEFAFIGRSNVGKSSLINMLCEQKKLAHTSATPGKTRLVNHFYINDQWYRVDLPGYGYAKISKKKTDQLSDIITHYICKSEELVTLFVLLDSRHDIQKIDLEFMMKLGELGIHHSTVHSRLLFDQGVKRLRRGNLCNAMTCPAQTVRTKTADVIIRLQ